jgi:site-specific DNA-methyltransferase (adenine-specific)/adenine-specific DNA-methyltransferase
LLGITNGIAVYLLFNGILRDKSVNGGNILTREILASLPLHEGTGIIYGNGCRISPERLRLIFYTFPPFLPIDPRIYAGFRAII